jgi:hypothetical protein
MATENQKPQQTTTVRIATTKKERVARVAFAMMAKEHRNVTEFEIVNKCLDKELPKLEKRLGLGL